jgi:cysteine desulfurase family protein (TIGR01976 family)
MDLDFVRRQFPALAGEWVFLDNAGGTQTLKQVVARLHEYLLTSNVQLGATYQVSQLAGQRVLSARQAMAELIHANDSEEVVMGSSTTLLLRILALCLGTTLKAGDEIIVTNCDHEANIGAWLQLQRAGIHIKFWKIDPQSLMLELTDLENLMNERTRLVALTHASNILGSINPIAEIADRVHSNGALICVDGVAYAPHRLVDVQELGVDFYVFSFYKIYGPHYALLYGKKEHLLKLGSFNHFFIGDDEIPLKFQPGNVNLELSYSMLGFCDYLQQLTQHHTNREMPTRESYQAAFSLMAEHEERLSARLLGYLNQKSNVRIVGHRASDGQLRLPIISFVVDGMRSSAIPPRIDEHKIAIRYGDFYARRLIEDLGLTLNDGIVRVSMVHYNTLEEVERLVNAFESVF